MQARGRAMKRLRSVLIESHVTATAVAMRLLWSMDLGLRSLWGPIYGGVAFLFMAVAILDIPYWSPAAATRTLLSSVPDFLAAIMLLVCAWVLARWVHGEGPIRIFNRYRAKLGRNRADST